MGRLNRIEQVINSTISHYSHGKVMPRGLTYFVDNLLRGRIRFGKRTGNTIATFSPDNTWKLKSEIYANQDKIQIDPISTWIESGSIISIGPGRETIIVDDVIGDSIILSKPLGQNHDTSELVLLHSVPIQMAAPANEGDTIITIKSHYELAHGDVFTYLQTPGFLESLLEVKSKQVIYGGTTSEYYQYIYLVELETPITRNLSDNETIYLRAYPAYFSNAVRVPNSITSSEQLGPVLLDYMSGKMIEGVAYKETFSYRTIDRGENYVEGNAQTYVHSYKNVVIPQRPIPTHTPLFWDLAEGAMRFTPNKIVMKPNAQGEFCAGFRAIPKFPVGGKWRGTLRSKQSAVLRFIFNPHSPIEYTLPPNTNVTFMLDTTAFPGPIENFEINYLSQGGANNEVTMTEWTPIGSTVVLIEYSIMAEATGISTWQSTGLMLKPYFLSLDLLSSYYDETGITYDAGKVYF